MKRNKISDREMRRFEKRRAKGTGTFILWTFLAGLGIIALLAIFGLGTFAN